MGGIGGLVIVLVVLRLPVLRVLHLDSFRLVPGLIHRLDGDLLKIVLQIPQPHIQRPVGQVSVTLPVHIDGVHAGEVVVRLGPQKPPVHSGPEGGRGAVKALNVPGFFKRLPIVAGNGHIDGAVFGNLHCSGVAVVCFLQVIGDVLPVPVFLHPDLDRGKAVSSIVGHADGGIGLLCVPAGGREDGDGHAGGRDGVGGLAGAAGQIGFADGAVGIDLPRFTFAGTDTGGSWFQRLASTGGYIHLADRAVRLG